MSDFIKVNTADGDELICHRNSIQIKKFNHVGTSAPDFSVKTGQSMEAIDFLEYERLCKELGVGDVGGGYNPCCIDRAEFVVRWLVEAVKMKARHLSSSLTGDIEEGRNNVINILDECAEEIKRALRGEPDAESDEVE